MVGGRRAWPRERAWPLSSMGELMPACSLSVRFSLADCCPHSPATALTCPSTLMFARHCSSLATCMLVCLLSLPRPYPRSPYTVACPPLPSFACPLHGERPSVPIGVRTPTQYAWTCSGIKGSLHAQVRPSRTGVRGVDPASL